MKILVRKMTRFGILKVQMIAGAIVMLAAMILMPVSITSIDPALFLEPLVLGIIGAGVLMFGAFAYFLFIRPFFLYRKLPDVLAETDGEYIYIHGTKEAKIPLAAFDGAVITYQLPFIYSKEFFAMLLTHLFSEKYGDLVIDVPEYGSYRLRFVAEVYAASEDLIAFLTEADISVEREISE